MALFEIVLQSLYAGQQCINRWNYLGAGTPAAVSLSFGLTSAMGFIASGEPPTFPADTVFSKIRQVVCMNVYDPTDFYTTAFPNGTVGTNSIGQGRATFEAAGFRTNLVNRDIARGTKRFVGVPSTWVGVGGVLNPDYVTQMETLAAAMAAPITYDDEGNTLSYNPAIVSKEKYTTPSGKTAYKYYASLTLQLSHIAQGFNWEAYDHVRSQVSRQVGKGN
jgi:hypothetical protein